ncbi:hypothetical protein BASA81_012135 [Batrachochytrium salamandrivorans]|nr:hypothetical protein BASA81_012135 [Batrachochytrium salamandrivorans]
MAKSLLLRVLRDTFGHLVEGLESDNLQVAVWSGEIHLENLSLKKDALDAFQDLPLEIKVGRIKSLRISIPWTRLGSEPVKISIDGVYALVVLKTHAPDPAGDKPGSVSTSDFLKRRNHREKLRMLRWASLTEDQTQSTPPKGSGGEEEREFTEEDAGFWSKLFSKVVDNLVVEVHNIHLRVEDHGQFTHRSFCAGVSIASFTAMTCDGNRKSTFVDHRASKHELLYRMVRCGEVAVYWDPPPTVPIPGNKTDDFWIGFLHASEFTPARTLHTPHQYILKPCSPSVFVVKNDFPTLESPRWEFEVTLEGVHLGLSRTQYQDVTSVHLALESQIVKSSQSRPVLSVGRNPRAWWRFAIHSTMRDLRSKKQRSSWLSLSRRIVLRERYVKLYKRTKKKPWLLPLTEQELGLIKEMENELELNDVLAFRATALAELRAEETKGNLPLVQRPVTANQDQGKTGWLRSFLGGGSEDQTNKKFELTPEEKLEINRAIDYLEVSQKTRVPEQTLNIVLKSSLNNATLSLVDGTREIMLLRAAGELVVETCVGPSMKTSFHLVAFELLDKYNADSIFPMLISPKTTTGSSSSRNKSPPKGKESVMTLTIEVKPHGKPEDIAISVSVVPFKIVLVPSWVGAVSRFFVIPEEARMLGKDFTEALEDKQDDLMEALARRTLISFRLEVDKPVVICPLMVTRAKHAQDYPCVVLGLERLQIESDDFRLNARNQDEAVEEEDTERLAIDAWKLHSQNARAFLVSATELISHELDFGWFSELEETDSRVLFHDFGFDAKLAVCITPKLLNIPKTRLSVSTSKLMLKAPPSLFRFANKLGTSWSKNLAGDNNVASVVVQQQPVPSLPVGVVDGPALFEIELSVEALIITLSQEMHNLPLARVELHNFSMKHCRKANGDVDSNMSLQSLQVLDLFSQTPPVLATSLLPSSSDDPSELDGGEEMISITVRYRSDATIVDANFHHLHVNWNPETVSAYKDAYHTAVEEEAAEIQLLQLQSPIAKPVAIKNTKALQVKASFHNFTLAMCKGSEGRVLAECIMSNTRLEVAQPANNGEMTFKFALGNFQTLQPLANYHDGNGERKRKSFEFFSSVVGADKQDLFSFQCIRPSAKHLGATYIGVVISPARLVFVNQMMLELVDYASQGVMGAMVTKAKDKLTTRTGEKFWMELEWNKPQILLPSDFALETNPQAGLELVCERINARNQFVQEDGVTISQIDLGARGVELVAFEPECRRALLQSPVGLELDIRNPLMPLPTITVQGQISPIEILLDRPTYFLLHRMLRENLLAEAPKPMSKPPTVAAVKYGYDEQGPPAKFNVSLFFSSASLQISECVGQEIATFAMREASVGLFRLSSDAPTTMKVAVQVLDLVDDRPGSMTRCFRHLILCNSSSDQTTFEVTFVNALGLVEINLNMFRSVVLLDLFFNVLNFITTTGPETLGGGLELLEEDENDLLSLSSMSEAGNNEDNDSLKLPVEVEEDPLLSAAATTTEEEENSPPATTTHPGWRGTFRLRQASMYFVADLDDPDTQCVVLGGDLDLEWRKTPNGCSTTWKGRIPNYELYRASMPRAQRSANNQASALALLEEAVGHQITEPSEVSFEYAYEYDSPHSKIHSRRFIFSMEQLENFLSITDLQTVLAVRESLARGDAGKSMARREYFEFKSAEEDKASVVVWPGLKTDRPSVETKPFIELGNSRLAKRRVRELAFSKKRFSVEFRMEELGLIEFIEKEGFVCVGKVHKPSTLCGLVERGDVLVAVNYTPVLTKSLGAILSILTEEKKLAGGNALFCLTFHASTCTLPLVLKDSLQFESKAIMLHLIDDIDGRDLPLVHVCFTKIDAFRNASNVAGKTTVMGANLLLAMHFHDAISGKWAMLMSPWTANLVVQWHSHGQIEAQFDTENDLQFQLSDVFVRAATNALRRFKQIDLLIKQDKNTGAILLRNRTGLPMWYRPIDEVESGPSLTGICILPEQTASLTFCHEHGDGAGTRRSYHKRDSDRVLVSFGEAWNQEWEIHANVVHRGAITLEAVDEDFAPASIRVCWEVNLDDGRLCLELRSFRQVCNRLRHPIQVFAKNPKASTFTVTVIAPGDTVSLPVVSGEVTELRFRPMLDSGGEQSDYHWSEACYVELASQRGSSNVTCAPSGGNGNTKWKPFLLHVQAEIQQADGATILFTVYPPIVVQNQLPSGLMCRFFYERRVVGDDVLLNAGGYSPIHAVTVEGSNSYVAFRLPNAKEWTSAVKVERKRKIASAPLRGNSETAAVSKRMEEIIQLNIIDGDGSLVPLSVVQETTEYEGIRFLVFCTHWLVNKTCLPLSYGYAQNKWSNSSRSSTTASSCPAGVMMFTNPEESGGKLQVRVSEQASAPFSVSTPDGKARQIVVPGGPSSMHSFDLSVSVDVGPGDLFRTNVVTFAPRYMFLNRLPNGTVLLVRQLWEDLTVKTAAAVLQVEPGSKEPFWASAYTRSRPFRLQIRCKSSEFETTWSNPFVLEKVQQGRAVVFVELTVANSKDLFRFNMEVREDQLAGCIDVDVSEWVQAAPQPTQEEAVEDEEVAPAPPPVVVAAPTAPLPPAPKSMVPSQGPILPKTQVKFEFPKVEVILRRDVAAKQKVRALTPLPANQPRSSPTLSSVSSTGSMSASAPLTRAASSTFSLMKRVVSAAPAPPPRPPAPLPPPPLRPVVAPVMTAIHPVSPRHQQQQQPVTTPPKKPISRSNGVSTEIARLIVIRSAVTLSQRVDFTRELVLKVYALRVIDTFPNTPFPDPCDGRNEDNPKMNFLSLHVIQKNNNVFERFYLRIPGLKLKVDERFVLDLAQFAYDTVLKLPSSASMDDNDCSLVIADILSTERTSKVVVAEEDVPKPSTSPNGFEIRLWYHQAKKQPHQRSLVNFGVLSKFNIKIANSKIKFNALSLVRPFGSQNLYLGIIKDHYETEARSQLGSMLFSAFDFSTAPLVLADTIITKILGSEVKSKEFQSATLTNDDIVTRYRRRLVETTSLEGFVRDVVRNAVFDWSYNHTGWLNSRKAIVLGVVNKSDHEVTISCSLVVGNCCYVLPGGLASRQLSNETVRIVPGAPLGGFDPSSTCLVIAGGFLSENVVLVCKSGAFTARFDHVDHTLKSGPGFSAAFLAKDTSNWLSWYVLVIENQV